MSVTLHDDIISVYISVLVYQQMFLTLHDDIISVYISVLVYQQMSLTLHEDIISVYISVSSNVPVVLGIFVDTDIYTLIISSCSVRDI
jgi:hypothetical protein